MAEVVWGLQTISAEKKTEYYERINAMESVQGSERVAAAPGFSLRLGALSSEFTDD